MNLAESEEALSLVDAEVDRALEPYVGLLSPADLESMRAYLRDLALLHPTVSELVERLVARAPVLESGDLPVDGQALALDPKARGGGKSG